MQYRKLGSSDLSVSPFSLGTMTFGLATPQADAFRQLDIARDHGINLIDTAELYPAPATAETYGESEQILGRWLASRGGREKILIATKVAGPAAFVPWIRDGASIHNAANLERALSGSLARMGTDYIDLLQLHWPDRATNFFGRRGFKPARREPAFNVEATVTTLDRMVQSGRVRHVGLCNETPWGLMSMLTAAREVQAASVCSVQQAYSLLDRQLEIGMLEVIWRENVGLLAHSPLAHGLLTGKYHDGSATDTARLYSDPHLRRCIRPSALAAAERYLLLAREAELDPGLMALALTASKPGVSSVIIGASNSSQLQHNLAALELRLEKTTVKAIEAIHEEIADPCP